jgi:hypothetical protein
MSYPAPDVGQAPRFGDSCRVVETVYGPENRSRVSISVDSAGTYRIHPEFWDVTDFEIIGYAYWNSVSASSLANDLDIARGLAAESLALVASAAQFSGSPL